MDYLITALTKERMIIQYHIVIDAEDQKFDGPLSCCVSASSMIFWRHYMGERGVEIHKAMTVRPITGSLK